MQTWTGQLKVTEREVRLLVVDEARRDLLKAALPLGPGHPRALLTLLEGVALYGGHPLCVAIVADDRCPSFLGADLFGNDLWPVESPLVRFEVAARGRPKRLRGLGDFRELRRAAQGRRR